jgi:hypothetical protein
VANILRALTDPRLLRHSLGRLGGGIAAGSPRGWRPARVSLAGRHRAVGLDLRRRPGGRRAHRHWPAVVGGLIGWALQPFFVSIGWLEPGDPPRKIMFLIALGTIMGAAIVDLALVCAQALAGARAARRTGGRRHARLARVDRRRLVLWVVVWGAPPWPPATGAGQPVLFLLVAVALVFLFAMVNGISVGVSDSNPISSAFVVSVVVMAALGLPTRASA